MLFIVKKNYSLFLHNLNNNSCISLVKRNVRCFDKPRPPLYAFHYKKRISINKKVRYLDITRTI